MCVCVSGCVCVCASLSVCVCVCVFLHVPAPVRARGRGRVCFLAVVSVWCMLVCCRRGGASRPCFPESGLPRE